MADTLKILETFRDSIQGLDRFIETESKVRILTALLKVGFDVVDVGSFVSSKVIPQFSDMDAVLHSLEKVETESKLFVLVANRAGAERSIKHESVQLLGYPFSTSERFLKRNINANFEQAWRSVNEIAHSCYTAGKELVVYLAMAFGNPYGDPEHVDVCLEWTRRFFGLGIRRIHLSDITGVSTPQQIGQYYCLLSKEFPTVEFGLHLHSSGEQLFDKFQAALDHGCSTFDGVISGLGGCPMTGYDLVRNVSTSRIIQFADERDLELNVDRSAFQQAKEITNRLLKTP